MMPFVTKGQACCLVLGEEVTEENKAKCKSYFQDTLLDVVYTADEDITRPRAMGKQVLARDPFTYLHYPDTPPAFPDRLPIVSTDGEPSSSASSVISDEDALVIKPTKHSILDFFGCIAFKQVSSINKERYICKKWTQEELYKMAEKYMPSISKHYTSRKMTEWLSKDGRFGRTTSVRSAGMQERSRQLWVLKDELQDDALRKVFNHQSYQQTVRSSIGWVTVGYARKSRSMEGVQTRVALLQKMAKTLRVKNLCEKVYVSPFCSADSPLMKRDSVPTAFSTSIMDKIRHKDGDLQDLILFAAATNLSIRLVVLDYAGLSSNPADIRAFVKQTKAIKELVIDHGHKLELITRHQILRGNAAKRFDCRKGGVKRSLL